jgi:hypothetical protein
VKLSALALEYVPVNVVYLKAGSFINPTGDSVQMAFTTPGVAPTGPDYKAAIWETDATSTPTRYNALCLVGPGGTVTLAAGLYDVWVKVTDSPEIPVEKAFQLEVF